MTKVFVAREAFLYLGERIFKQLTSLRVHDELILHLPVITRHSKLGQVYVVESDDTFQT